MPWHSNTAATKEARLQADLHFNWRQTASRERREHSPPGLHPSPFRTGWQPRRLSPTALSSKNKGQSEASLKTHTLRRRSPPSPLFSGPTTYWLGGSTPHQKCHNHSSTLGPPSIYSESPFLRGRALTLQDKERPGPGSEPPRSPLQVPAVSSVSGCHSTATPTNRPADCLRGLLQLLRRKQVFFGSSSVEPLQSALGKF